jgi:hypothetical protein
LVSLAGQLSKNQRQWPSLCINFSSQYPRLPDASIPDDPISAAHDLALESDLVGNAIPGLVVRGIGGIIQGALEGVTRGVVEVLGVVTGEAIVAAADEIEMGEGGDETGEDTPTVDAGSVAGVPDDPDAPSGRQSGGDDGGGGGGGNDDGGSGGDNSGDGDDDHPHGYGGGEGSLPTDDGGGSYSAPKYHG